MICTQNPGHIELRSRLTHGCFPVFNRGHPFCFSLDPLVIVVVYVFLYCSLELIELAVLLFISIEHLILHPSKESLHDTVIIAVPFP